MAWKRKDLRKAHAAAQKGEIRQVVLQLLANEIQTQDNLDGVGDEAFRRSDIMLRLLDTAKEIDVVNTDPLDQILGI